MHAFLLVRTERKHKMAFLKSQWMMTKRRKIPGLEWLFVGYYEHYYALPLEWFAQSFLSSFYLLQFTGFKKTTHLCACHHYRLQ